MGGVGSAERSFQTCPLGSWGRPGHSSARPADVSERVGRAPGEPCPRKRTRLWSRVTPPRACSRTPARAHASCAGRTAAFSPSSTTSHPLPLSLPPCVETLPRQSGPGAASPLVSEEPRRPRQGRSLICRELLLPVPVMFPGLGPHPAVCLRVPGKPSDVQHRDSQQHRHDSVW